MRIGDYAYDFPVYLAPMAGYTDAVYRSLCREQGADVVTTEMVSAKGLHFNSDKTEALFCSAEPYPYVVQLFGSDAEIVSESAARIADRLGDRLLCLDLNMGCPAPKITNNGDGSALMKDPVLAGKIIERTVKRLSVPVSVKFRKGWSEREVNAAAFASMCEESGASVITVHPRTRERMYAGSADWDVLAQVKQTVHIPVIGNGDIQCGADVLRMRAQTGVDGVMVGRAALGNPFVFAEIKAALAGKPYLQPTAQLRRMTALQHAELVLNEKGDHAIIELRKHIACYVRGVPGAAQLRTRVNEATTLAQLRQILT